MPIKIIDIFSSVASEILPQRFEADSCLNATRITLEVMRKFNVPAFPLVTQAIAANNAFAERVHIGGHWPRDQEETARWSAEFGAHSVGVGYSNEDRPGRYGGHLVAIVRGTLVDASARQMSRPNHNMIVPAIVALDKLEDGFLSGAAATGIVLDDGTLLTYKALPRRKDYATISGFTASVSNMCAASDIVAEMRRRM